MKTCKITTIILPYETDEQEFFKEISFDLKLSFFPFLDYCPINNTTDIFEIIELKAKEGKLKDGASILIKDIFYIDRDDNNTALQLIRKMRFYNYNFVLTTKKFLNKREICGGKYLAVAVDGFVDLDPEIKKTKENKE